MWKLIGVVFGGMLEKVFSNIPPKTTGFINNLSIRFSDAGQNPDFLKHNDKIFLLKFLFLFWILKQVQEDEPKTEHQDCFTSLRYARNDNRFSNNFRK